MKINVALFPVYSEKTRSCSRWHFIFRPLPGCAHGPQSWPWWRWISFSIVKLGCVPPTTGWSLWMYTRRGARAIDIYFDRRSRGDFQ